MIRTVRFEEIKRCYFFANLQVRTRDTSKKVLLKHKFWRLLGITKWLGPFVSRKTKGCFPSRTCILEQEKHELSLLNLANIFFETSTFGVSIAKEKIGAIRFNKKQNCAIFSTNLHIRTRKTWTLVIKVVKKTFCKNTIFGISIAKYNIGTIRFDKKQDCAIFFTNLHISTRKIRTFVIKVVEKVFLKK